MKSFISSMITPSFAYTQINDQCIIDEESLNIQIDELKYIDFQIKKRINKCDKLFSDLKAIEEIKDSLLKSNVSLRKFKTKILQTTNITEYNSTIGFESFDFSNKESIIAGCENIIQQGYEKIKEFFRWILNKLKDFFTKVKKFIVDLFNSNTRKMKRIKRQLAILDNLINEKDLLRSDLNNFLQNIAEMKVKFVKHQTLIKSFDMTIRIAEDIISEYNNASSNNKQDDDYIKKLHKDIIDKNIRQLDISDAETIQFLSNLFSGHESDIKLTETTIGALLSIGNIKEISLSDFYECLYTEIKNISEKCEKISINADKIIDRFVKKSNFINTGNNTPSAALSYDSQANVFKIFQAIATITNKSITNEIITSNTALSNFENGINKYIKIKFDNKVAVVGIKNPVLCKRVYTYEGIGVYICIKSYLYDGILVESEPNACWFTPSLVATRSQIFVSPSFLRIPDDDMKNWILAHELGHGINVHTLTGIYDKIFDNEDIDDNGFHMSNTTRFESIKDIVNTLKHRLLTRSQKSEYEADAYAYRKYGYDISMKTLLWSKQTYPDESSPSHPSFSDRITAIEILEKKKRENE